MEIEMSQFKKYMHDQALLPTNTYIQTADHTSKVRNRQVQ